MYYSTILVETSVSLRSLTLPTATLETPGAISQSTYGELCGVLVFAALLVAGYFASDAFNSPIMTPDDGPTPPRYMTQRHQYRLGMIAYIGLCLVGYGLIVVFYPEFSPFIAPFEPEPLRVLQSSQMSFPMVVILGVAALVILHRLEHEWNPFFILRRVVRAWVSIPELANCIAEATRNQLVVRMTNGNRWRATPAITSTSAISTKTGRASIGFGRNSAICGGGSRAIATRART
jgi:hypothetical protein